MKNIAAVILAAGRGTRMKSKLPKVLMKLHSRPLLEFVINTLDAVPVTKKVLVVGFEANMVKNAFPGIETVVQDELLGSGDAVKKAKAALSRFKGDILVICGDTPFISKETIRKLVKRHRKDKASCTLLTANVSDPEGYGRILRDTEGAIINIVEEKDASVYEKSIGEINVGCYFFAKKDLFSSLEKVKMNAKKGEYYLTDVIGMLAKGSGKISSVNCEDPMEAHGINSRLDLAKAGKIIKESASDLLMLNGVTIVDPNTTYIDMDAKIERDTVIYPNTVIERDVIIGKDCRIGPFARIRRGTRIDDNVEIGNFVEIVRSTISTGTKIKHLSYFGDAKIGRNVNVGAGTITANYDGKKKNKTIIENDASIGVGVVLIAPVKIGRKATVGAGSVVTKNKNVPPRATFVGVPAKLLKR
ncbi:MAG: NTP transferase domain-containing protein [Candidatus Omnitrophota bacterium]